MFARHLGAPGLEFGIALQGHSVELNGRLHTGAGAQGFAFGQFRRLGQGHGFAQAHLQLAFQNRPRLLGQHQGVEGLHVHHHRAHGQQLAQHAAQLQLAQMGAHAKGAQALVAVLGHFFGLFAAHNVHQLARAKADAAELVDAVNGGQKHLCGLRAVPHSRWMQAVVAIAAGLAGLAKISEQAGAPAVNRLGQAQERL